MLRVALTGGLAAGKSTVARLLATYPGVVVVDSDALARDVTGPGAPSLARLARAFGAAVLTPDGELDRAALARLAFASDDARLRLEAILHPLIRQRADALTAAAESGGARVVVRDIPLLVETADPGDYDLVVTVSAPPGVRLGRAVATRGWTREEALGRMAAQATDDDREAVADVVLDGSGPVSNLKPQVEELVKSRFQLD
jgi:dephospho-CoA kinase